MESANLHHHHHHHHHQLQEHQLLVGSSSLATPISLYGVGIINNNSSWNQNLILNNAAGHDFNLSSSGNGILSNSSRDLRQNNNNEIHHHQVSPSLSTATNSMIHDHQDLGFHWATTTTGRSSFIDDQYSAHDQVLHLAKIKKELISSSEYSHHDQEAGTYLDEFQLAVAAAASARNNYLKLHDQELEDLHDLSSSSTTTEKQLFLRNLISSGDHLYYCNPQNPVGSFAQPYSSTRSGNIFSQIFPSTNISNPNPSSLSSSFSSTAPTQYPLGMNNFQALDLLSSSPSSTKIGGNSNTFGQDSSSILSQNNNLGRGREVIMKESHRLSYDDDHHHLDHHDLQIRSSSSLNWPLNNPSKMSSCLMNVGGRDQVTTKISSCSSSSSTTSGLATKASHHTAAAPPKKPRLESRSSFPPIKVRKEKLGDRIANLQQLVAPFGKTDTASVLMEAIGYIKFLQEQVETLSVPYMKSSSSIRNINIRPKIQRGSMAPGEGEMDEPIKRDLRSRGLCLVPLSCTSYITNDVDLGVNWSSPHYGGGRL